MSEKPSVYLYENGYGEIRYQPMLPDARRLWKRYDGYVEETEKKWATTVVFFSDFKPVLYSSKKKALKVARRKMQKEERKEKSVFHPVGKETTDDEA